MIPVKFAEANKNLLRPNSMSDEECKALWVFTDGSICVSRWHLSWRDRIRALWYGHIWLTVHSGGTQPPVRLDSDVTIFEPAESQITTEKLA